MNAHADTSVGAPVGGRTGARDLRGGRAGSLAAVGRVPELDGLRGIAILLVVFAHITEGLRPDRALLPSLDSMGGLVGVHLFFVLSGYLITRILLSERERTGSLDLLAFYKRRLSRLYPSLLLVAGLVAVVDPWSAFRAVTYSSNVLLGEHGRGILAHSWSLSVEEQFYLAWPALLLMAGRSRAVYLAALGILATVLLQHVVPWSDRAVYYGLRWDAILSGCLLALTAWRPPRLLLYPGLAVLALMTLGAFGEFQPWFYSASTLACIPIVAGAQGTKWLAAPWLVHVGRLSYAWYLWHGVVMRLDYHPALTVPASLALAQLTWMLVDRKAQERKVRGPGPTDSPRHALADE